MAKELIDTIDLVQEEEPKKQIVDQLMVPLYSLDPLEIFMKPQSIDNDINAANTHALIKDLNDYSGPFLKKEEVIDLAKICVDVEECLPELIDIEDILKAHDATEKAKLLLKYITEECTGYNASLELVRSDISKVIACLNGDIVHKVTEVKQSLKQDQVPQSWCL